MPGRKSSKKLVKTSIKKTSKKVLKIEKVKVTVTLTCLKCKKKLRSETILKKK